ncbi:uncharacterized protein [Pocillopora verrucosa]|uniref:uncharacterized protein isoform X4 n=1 Tax=Pocillopora verrucosa TaxID=203993 RepID=UPI00333F2F3E
MESFPAWEKKANQGTTEVQIESFPGKKKAKQGPSPAHPPSDSGKTRNRVKYKLNPSLGKKKAKQGPSPAHPPSDSGKPRNRVKYKLNPSLGKKRPSKDQVLHIHLVTQGNQGPTEVQIESFPGKKRSLAVVKGLLTAVTSPRLQLQQVTCKGRNGAGVM